LQFTHVPSFACRGGLRKSRADCPTDGLYCVTIPWQQTCEGLLYITVAGVLLHETVERTHHGRQARNQLGTSGGAKSFPRGTQIFWTMSNIFKLCVIHFSRGGKNFSAPPWLRAFWQIMQRDSDMLIAVCHVNLHFVKRSMSESVAMLTQVWKIHY